MIVDTESLDSFVKEQFHRNLIEGAFHTAEVPNPLDTSEFELDSNCMQGPFDLDTIIATGAVNQSERK